MARRILSKVAGSIAAPRAMSVPNPRTIKPAPANNTTASAISADTKTLRIRCRLLPFKAPAKFGCEPCHAGANELPVEITRRHEEFVREYDHKYQILMEHFA